MLKQFTGPVRDFFNTRFVGVSNSLQALQLDVDALRLQVSDLGRTISESVTNDVGATLDSQHSDLLSVAGFLGRSIDQTADGVAALLERMAPDVLENTGKLRSDAPEGTDLVFDQELSGAVDQLDRMLADVANYALSHRGWASQAGLWFNPPISIEHAPGELRVANINERIAEIPFIFSALGTLPRGSRILDVGSTESTVSVSLASLGYDVTAVDPRPYPLSHERLTNHVGPIETFSSETPFDGALLLSSIEHFGLGAYDLPVNEKADLEAIQRVWDLVRPGGMLVLTTPYGIAETTDLQRTYTPDQIDTLLEGWTILERSYLTQVSPTEWHRVEEINDFAGSHVVLVRATKPEA